jgi:hypothetical protein
MPGPGASLNQGVGRTQRPEPRSMILADVMAVVAGLGIAFLLPPNSGMLPFMPIPVWFIVASLVVWSLLALGLATALAVLVRQLTYRRRAHPAEWLAVLSALLLVQRAVPNLDTAVNGIFGPSWTSNSFGLCRWIVGGAAMAAFLLSLAVLGLVRRAIPYWTKTLFLAVFALILLWGPFQALAMEGPWLFPSGSGLQPQWMFWIYGEGLRYVAWLPPGLLFGVPATAALADWRQRGSRRWVWTEWMGIGIVLLLGFLWIGELYLRSEWPSDRLNAERAVLPVWVLGVWWLSRRAIAHFRNAWSHWLMSPATSLA